MIEVDWSLFQMALGAALTAFAYSVSVYFSKTDEENWKFVKAGKTALLSAVVAFGGAYFGVSKDVIMASPYYAFIGILIERILKVIKRKWLPKIKSG